MENLIKCSITNAELLQALATLRRTRLSEPQGDLVMDEETDGCLVADEQKIKVEK